MDRIQFLAAETFHYSYDNYDDHLGVNERFDRLMPKQKTLNHIPTPRSSGGSSK